MKKKIVGAFWELPAKSRANPAKFGWKWAGLAMLFSLQLQNGSHDFFHIFSILFFNLRTTNAFKFLTHIISAIGGVW